MRNFPSVSVMLREERGTQINLGVVITGRGSDRKSHNVTLTVPQRARGEFEAQNRIDPEEARRQFSDQILRYLRFRAVKDEPLDRDMCPTDEDWQASRNTTIFESEQLQWRRMRRAVCVSPQPVVRRSFLEWLYDVEASGELRPTSDFAADLIDGFIDPKVIGFAAKYLERAGYVQQVPPDRVTRTASNKYDEYNWVFELTSKGIDQVERWHRVVPGRAMGFAIMAFRQETQKLWEEAIGPALVELRLAPIRVDQVTLSEPVIDAIHRFIADADLVFADLTYARPNCYYEVGMARALRRNIIMTVREKNFQDDVHFDATAFQIEPWTDNDLADLRQRLVHRGHAALNVASDWN